MIDPIDIFHGHRYLRSTFRRLEYLAALSLPIESRTVLEVGAGIGDFTSFFLDRDCRVTSVEPREENIAIFRARYARDPLWEAGRLKIVQSTIADLLKNGVEPHDVVACLQVLNFSQNAESAIGVLASYTKDILLLETACDSGEGRDGDEIRSGETDASDPGGSITGAAWLPTRQWVFNRLKPHFRYVYMALLQAQFDRFRLYWGRADASRGHDRVVFVASRSPLDNPLLVDFVPTVQFRRLPNAADAIVSAGMRLVKTVFGPMLTIEDDDVSRKPYSEFDVLLQFTNEGDVVYDFGAGIGMYAVALGIAVGDRGRVLASERREPYAAALQHNVRSHGTNNVQCNASADCAPGRAALVRISPAGMSDADWRHARSIVERDLPLVYADEARDLRDVHSGLGYAKGPHIKSGALLVPRAKPAT